MFSTAYFKSNWRKLSAPFQRKWIEVATLPLHLVQLLTTWKQTRKLSLLNKESLESGLHGCPIELPGTIDTPGTPVTRWLADRNGNSGIDVANVLGMPFHGNVDESPKVSRTVYLYIMHYLSVQSLKVSSGPKSSY